MNLSPMDGDTAVMMLDCGDGNLTAIAEYFSAVKERVGHTDLMIGDLKGIFQKDGKEYVR